MRKRGKLKRQIRLLELRNEFLEEYSSEMIKDNVVLAMQVEHALDHIEWLKEAPCISALLGEDYGGCGCPSCSADRTYFLMLVDGMMRQYMEVEVGDRDWKDVFGEAMTKGLKAEVGYKTKEE